MLKKMVYRSFLLNVGSIIGSFKQAYFPGLLQNKDISCHLTQNVEVSENKVKSFFELNFKTK